MSVVVCPRCGWGRLASQQAAIATDIDGSCLDKSGCARRAAQQRCGAWLAVPPDGFEPFACTLPRGHAGMHQRSTVRWTVDSARAPRVTDELERLRVAASEVVEAWTEGRDLGVWIDDLDLALNRVDSRPGHRDCDAGGDVELVARCPTCHLELWRERLRAR